MVRAKGKNCATSPYRGMDAPEIPMMTRKMRDVSGIAASVEPVQNGRGNLAIVSK